MMESEVSSASCCAKLKLPIKHGHTGKKSTGESVSRDDVVSHLHWRQIPGTGM